MLQYPAEAGEHRQSALRQYGEINVDQARKTVQKWLAELRNGGQAPRGQGRRPQGSAGAAAATASVEIHPA